MVRSSSPDKCRVCLNFDDINDQHECMDCVDGSNFSITASVKRGPSWDDVIKGRQTSFTECEVCGDQGVCVEIKEESFVIEVCRTCILEEDQEV